MSGYAEFLEDFRCFKLWTEECVRLSAGLAELISVTAEQIADVRSDDIPRLRDVIGSHFLSDYPTEFYKHLLSYNELFSGQTDSFIQLYELANAENLQPRMYDGVTTVTAHQTILNMAGVLRSKYIPVSSSGDDCLEVSRAISTCSESLFEYDLRDSMVWDQVRTQFTLEHVRAERWVHDNFERLTAIVSPDGQGSSANSANSQEIFIPGNPDLTDLCKLLKDRPEGVSQNSVAREFLKGTGKNWEGLIQQARKPKYRPLWDPGYKKKTKREQREL